MASPGPPDELLALLASLGDPSACPTVAPLLATVLGELPDIVAILDVEGCVLHINHPVGDAQELLGRPAWQCPAFDAEALCRELQEVRAGGQRRSFTSRGAGRAGPATLYRNLLMPLRRDGDTVGMIVVATDRSEEEAVLESLRQSEARLRLALDSTTAGLWEIPSTRRREVHLDDRARAIYELEPSDDGRYSAELVRARIHPDDWPAVMTAIQAAEVHEERFRMQHRVLRPGGETRWVQAHGLMVRNHDGTRRLVGTLLDETEERVQVERQNRAQKLGAIGELAAGVAHNFNNMLTAVIGHLELAAESAEGETAELMEGARTASLRASRMVRQLLTFTGQHESRPRPVQLEQVSRRVLDLCRNLFDAGITLVEDLPEEPLPPVLVDDAQIEQALLNVLLNARDALQASGTESPRVTLRVRAVEGGSGVEVRIEDNGPGIPQALHGRVFEPFFTTKEVGKGTGLGLATAYAIVNDHGGTLELRSVPGDTAFTLRFPATEGVVRADTTTEPPPRNLRSIDRSRRVLLVEDETLVRRAVRRLLARAGYEIEEAENGLVALDLDRAAREAGHPFDAVILDLSMPGMGGRRLLTELRGRDSGAALIVYTGVLAPDVEPLADAVLLKPVEGPRLVASVEAALHARALG